MTLEPGQLLRSRYKIISVLTHGGMGSIYKALDESLNYEVAVKENLFTTEDYSRQFRKEATILANLRHPNLPRVTDHFVLDNQGQYLVMDYIEGEDLRQEMARLGSIPEDKVVSIGASICDALTYLHSRQPPVLHRDIKPGNIKITPNDQVFLVDFGLARLAETGQATTIGAQALTPGYAPPEQYGQGTDPRSDVYALGATLYAALTGKIPEDALARAMGTVELTPIRAYKNSVSERAAGVIEKAMSVKSEDRYQSAGDFKLALINSNTAARRKAIQTAPQPTIQEPTFRPLTEALSSSPTLVAAPPVTPLTAHGGSSEPPVAKKVSYPNWILIILAGVVLLGFLVVGGLFLKDRLGGGTAAVIPTLTYTPIHVVVAQTATEAPTRTLPPPTLLPTPTILPTVTLPVLANTPVFTTTPTASLTPAATPVGGGSGEIAFVSIRDNKKPQLWIMAPDGSNSHAITDLPDGACQPDWSPDGKRLVYISPCDRKSDGYPGASLFIMNLDGSGLISISTTPQGDFDPAWSPDGSLIAFTSLRDRSSHIYLYNLQDGTTKRISAVSVTDSQPAWSPDSKQLVFMSTRGGLNQIWTMNADGSSPKEFSLPEWGPAFKPAWSPDRSVILYNQSSELPRLVGQRIQDRFAQFDVAKNLRPVVDVSYSPDGLWLAFEGIQENQNHDIFIMDRNGTRVTRLTTDPGFDFQPAWRP